MGNRATVIFQDTHEISPAIYLHWNGGPESVYAFLAEMERRNGFSGGAAASAARFAQIAGDLFDSESNFDGLSLYLFNGPKRITPAALRAFSAEDNGQYIVVRKNGSTFVRRFRERFDTSELVELSEEAVRFERESAAEHKYAAGFRETFERLFPTKVGA